ncbi:MAG: hypothetical protein CVT49_13480 [candidate division Zixibacteria bacterium HGW-Zixibacteria-1]|nr:MAG: hypothetical protein CVT49_13480 [candidate division Zixibacteria bacterium HGW-Zixibacteria-1]
MNGDNSERKKFNESTIAHMAMIQGIVTRLETNCFTLKALAMTLAVAVLAFLGAVQKPNWLYLLAGCFPVVVFWIMDAQYLRLGRLFRHLYSAVRSGELEDPFSMNFKAYEKFEQITLRIAFSWSILWFYLSILAAFAVVSIIFLKKGA